jgi:hypothetical protein
VKNDNIYKQKKRVIICNKKKIPADGAVVFAAREQHGTVERTPRHVENAAAVPGEHARGRVCVAQVPICIYIYIYIYTHTIYIYIIHTQTHTHKHTLIITIHIYMCGFYYVYI